MCCSCQLFFFISSSPLPFSFFLFLPLSFLEQNSFIASFPFTRPDFFGPATTRTVGWCIWALSSTVCLLFTYIYIYVYVLSLFYPACGRPKDLWGVPWDVPFGQGRYNQAAIVWCDDAWLPRDSRRFFPKARHDGSNVSCFIGEELFFFFLLFTLFILWIHTCLCFCVCTYCLLSCDSFTLIVCCIHTQPSFLIWKSTLLWLTFLHYLVLS